MRIPLDREKKIILLRWLKQGYIDTMDLPEAYRDGTLFSEFLIESGLIDENSYSDGSIGFHKTDKNRKNILNG